MRMGKRPKRRKNRMRADTQLVDKIMKPSKKTLRKKNEQEQQYSREQRGTKKEESTQNETQKSEKKMT